MDTYSKYELTNAIKKGGNIREDPPLVEKVNPYEVYLLDEEGERLKKICGGQRRGLPEGYVCTQSAGHNTNHPGIGPCKKHDYSIPNSRNTRLWDTLNRAHGLPSTLSEYLSYSDDIEERHLTTVDEDIKTLYGILSYQLSKRNIDSEDLKKSEKELKEITLSNADLDLALKIMDKILKAKDIRMKLSKELILDTSTIKMFVHQIFRVATEKLAEHQAKMLLNAFLEEVIIPFQTKGRIKGSDFNYEPESGKIIGEVKQGK